MQLRDYQRRAANDVCRAWHEGHRRVCLVIPTAGGKSVVAAELVRRARAAGVRVLAVAHRRELIEQLCGHFGPEAAPVCAGMDGDESKPIQVASVQTLLARETPIECGLVVADECQHLYPNGRWTDTVAGYGDVRWVGLTATPERADGQPLGDVFDRLIVGAQYSELLAAGHIVPCDVYHPRQQLQKGVAMSPVEAYQKFGNGGQAFVFCSSVENAYDTANNFMFAGIAADAVEGDTGDDSRRKSIADFRAGKVKVLTNVFVYTEGTDVPNADVCILARGVGHASTYLQMVGRVLRSAPGKTKATLVDLCGSVLAHGLPTSDREYSLSGRAIGVGEKGRALRVCLQCGYTWERTPQCPRCGFTPTPKGDEPRIYDVELKAIYAGADTTDDAKGRELDRLRAVANSKGWSVGWVVKCYRELFGEAPPGYVFSEQERKEEWTRLEAIARDRGYKRGYAFARYKATFGSMPKWGW